MKELKHVLVNFGSRLGTAVFSLLISILISRQLGSEAKGFHALFILNIALMQLATHLFSGSALIFLASRLPFRFLISLSLSWSVFSSFLLGFILWISNLLPEAHRELLIASGILYALWSALSNLILGKGNTNAYSMINFVQAASIFLLTLTLFELLKPEIASFIYAFLFSQVISLGVCIYYTSKINFHTENTTEKTDWKHLFRHGFYITLAGLTQLLSNRVLYFIIESRFGLGYLGIYSNAMALGESIWLIPRSFSTVLMAKGVTESDNTANRKLTRRYVLYSLLISAAAMVFLLSLPGSFYTWLFGAGFGQIKSILPYLSAAILFGAMAHIYAHYFAGQGANHHNFYGSLINLMVLLLSFWTLISIGILAAPISASLSFLAMFLWLWWRFKG